MHTCGRSEGGGFGSGLALYIKKNKERGAMHDILDLLLKWLVPFVLTTIASGAIAYSKGSHKRASDREKAIE